MALTEQQIEKFRELCKTHFGDEVSRGEAIEKGMQLVSLMRLIYRPMSEVDLQRVLKRRKELGLD